MSVRDALGDHFPETIPTFDDRACLEGGCDHPDWPENCPGSSRTICGGVCSVPDTGDFGTCDLIWSPNWPCRPTRKARLRVVST